MGQADEQLQRSKTNLLEIEQRKSDLETTLTDLIQDEEKLQKNLEILQKSNGALTKRVQSLNAEIAIAELKGIEVREQTLTAIHRTVQLEVSAPVFDSYKEWMQFITEEAEKRNIREILERLQEDQ